MLQTKHIKTPPAENDGLRISVMSRHTLPDGKTADTEITPHLYDLWMPQQLGPPSELIGAYYRGEVSWDEFENAYDEHLKQPASMEMIALLGTIALEDNITLLCIEESPERCHRRLLAQACLVQVSSLELNVR